jgi:hypothetical protein
MVFLCPLSTCIKERDRKISWQYFCQNGRTIVKLLSKTPLQNRIFSGHLPETGHSQKKVIFAVFSQKNSPATPFFITLIISEMGKGTQCFYQCFYACACKDSNGNGGPDCPSSRSLEIAAQCGIFIDPSSKGRLVFLPQKNDEVCKRLREKILLEGGVDRGSVKWNDAMALSEDNRKFAKVIKLCACHIDQNDLMEGQREGTLVFRPTAQVRSPNFMCNNAQSKRESPFKRAADQVDEQNSPINPLAKRFESDLLNLKSSVDSQMLENDREIAKLKERLGEMEKTVQILRTENRALTRDYNASLESLGMLVDDSEIVGDIMELYNEENKQLKGEMEMLMAKFEDW